MSYYVYILSNGHGNALYVGVTNDLLRRVYEHKHELVEGFTKKYHIHKLLYYEIFSDIKDAIFREKQVKKYSRKKKFALVDLINSERRDLYEEINE